MRRGANYSNGYLRELTFRSHRVRIARTESGFAANARSQNGRLTRLTREKPIANT